MQLKPITVIAVLLLLVASLSVTGCISNTTNQTPSPSVTLSTVKTSGATHRDAFLEKYLTQYTNIALSNSSYSIKSWEITWINNTSVRLKWTGLDKSTNQTARWDETLIVFPTSKDATNYLNAMNKTAYSLASEELIIQAYRKAAGHTPKIDKFIVYSEGSPSEVSAYRIHGVKQLDNLIITSTVRY
jgi:hypothetical protein